LGSFASRLTELKKKQAQEMQNHLICPLIEEYFSSRSDEKEGSSPLILTGVEKIA